MQVLTLISILTSNSRWTSWAARSDGESASDTRTSTRRLIEAADEGEAEEPYRDEPDESANQDQGPIVAPALLQNDSDNAWRT